MSYGGDEYVMVLPHIGKEAGVRKAEEIRTCINETDFLVSRGLQLHIGVSFGVATYPEDAKDMTALLGLADRMLFAAKERGKNTVVQASATYS